MMSREVILTRPINVSVHMGGKIRTIDQLIRKFIKRCKEENIVKEVKDRLYYESKGAKRRKKRHAAKARSRSNDSQKFKGKK